MILKYSVNDIVLCNVQGVMTTGIITRITVLGETGIIYTLDYGTDIREDQVTRWLGNAEAIKKEMDDELIEKDGLS